VKSENNVHRGNCIGNGIVLEAKEFKFMSEIEERHKKALDNNKSLGLQKPYTI